MLLLRAHPKKKVTYDENVCYELSTDRYINLHTLSSQSLDLDGRISEDTNDSLQVSRKVVLGAGVGGQSVCNSKTSDKRPTKKPIWSLLKASM